MVSERVVSVENLEEDKYLTAEQLDDKYNPDGDGEHPCFKRRDWRDAVDQEDTLMGYWDWVVMKLEGYDYD